MSGGIFEVSHDALRFDIPWQLLSTGLVLPQVSVEVTKTRS
jgi:hypothetical protein